MQVVKLTSHAYVFSKVSLVTLLMLSFMSNASLARVANSSDSFSSLAKIFLQADSVHREFYRVTSGHAKSMMKSPFGKLSRAFSTRAGESLTMKSNFSCDRYQVDGQDSLKFPRHFIISENCVTKLKPTELATVSWMSQNKIKVTFRATNLTEVLGIGTLIAGKDFNCDLVLTNQASLTSYHCEKWYEDKFGSEVYEFKNYFYEAEGTTTISSDGVILKDLYPERKIEVRVPKNGKILVRETVLASSELARPKPTVKPVEVSHGKKPQPADGGSGQSKAIGILPDPDYQNINGGADGKENNKKNSQSQSENKNEGPSERQAEGQGTREEDYQGSQQQSDQGDDESGGQVHFGPVTPRSREDIESRRYRP